MPISIPHTTNKVKSWEQQMLMPILDQVPCVFLGSHLPKTLPQPHAPESIKLLGLCWWICKSEVGHVRATSCPAEMREIHEDATILIESAVP